MRTRCFGAIAGVAADVGAAGVAAVLALAPVGAGSASRPVRRGAIALWTSCFITRPAAPEPWTAPRLTSCSFAIALGGGRGARSSAGGPSAGAVGGGRRLPRPPVLDSARCRRRRAAAAPLSSTTREQLADLDVLAFLALDAGDHAALARRSPRGRSSRFRARRRARRPRRGRLPSSASARRALRRPILRAAERRCWT